MHSWRKVIMWFVVPIDAAAGMILGLGQHYMILAQKIANGNVIQG